MCLGLPLTESLYYRSSPDQGQGQYIIKVVDNTKTRKHPWADCSKVLEVHAAQMTKSEATLYVYNSDNSVAVTRVNIDKSQSLMSPKVILRFLA